MQSPWQRAPKVDRNRCGLPLAQCGHTLGVVGRHDEVIGLASISSGGSQWCTPAASTWMAARPTLIGSWRGISQGGVSRVQSSGAPADGPLDDLGKGAVR